MQCSSCQPLLLWGEENECGMEAQLLSAELRSEQVEGEESTAEVFTSPRQQALGMCGASALNAGAESFLAVS